MINASSGRSLQTERRIPDCVVSGTFDYGFKLGLMAKDVRIANKVLDAHFPEAEYFRRTGTLLEAAVEAHGYDADYTEAVKVLEATAGATLRGDGGGDWDKGKDGGEGGGGGGESKEQLTLGVLGKAAATGSVVVGL